MHSLLVSKDDEITQYLQKKGIKNFKQHQIHVFYLTSKEITLLKEIIKNYSYLLDTL